MANNKLGGFSSAFDSLLDQNRREMDNLFGSSPRPQVPTQTRYEEPVYESKSKSRLAENSPTARLLNSRYGDGWRFEVVEQRREDDDIVIVGRLSIRDNDLSVTQTGRAQVKASITGQGSEIAGTADGIAFSIRSEGGVGSSDRGDAEEVARQEAMENAAVNCVQWLQN